MSDKYEALTRIIKGLAYVNVYMFDIERAKLWKRNLEWILDDQVEDFNLDPHIIVRLASASHLSIDNQREGIETINRMSIECPAQYTEMKEIINALTDKIS